MARSKASKADACARTEYSGPPINTEYAREDEKRIREAEKRIRENMKEYKKWKAEILKKIAKGLL